MERRAHSFHHQQPLFFQHREIPLCLGQLNPRLPEQFAGLQFRFFDDQLGIALGASLDVVG